MRWRVGQLDIDMGWAGGWHGYWKVKAVGNGIDLEAITCGKYYEGVSTRVSQRRKFNNI